MHYSTFCVCTAFLCKPKSCIVCAPSLVLRVYTAFLCIPGHALCALCLVLVCASHLVCAPQLVYIYVVDFNVTVNETFNEIHSNT